MILKKCDMKTFSMASKGKKIACYGIGSDFERIIKNYAGYEWISSIAYLVDNSPNKQGQSKEIGRRRFTIKSLEDLLKTDLKDTIIFITCAAYYEIIEQLNQVFALDHTECYMFYFMFSLSEGENFSIRQTDKMLIPPVIHYCWFGRGELPDLYKRCIDSWHKYCPDYEIKQWNEDNCDIEETLFTKQAYEMKKYGFVPDYFRLKIIYENGGIYLDTDVEVLKNLDDLRYNEAFCGLQLPGEVGLGLGFGACKGNELMKYLMRRYESMPFIKPDGSMDETISGLYQTKDLMAAGMKYGSKLQNCCGMTIYPVEVLSPRNINTGEYNITDKSYSVHYYDGSWASGERLEKKKKRLQQVEQINRLFR